MSYVKTVWQERIVATANKFLKSGETDTEVTLVNDPGTVTQAGTPFSISAMNNLEDGVEALHKIQVADYGTTGERYPLYEFTVGNTYILIYTQSEYDTKQRSIQFLYSPQLSNYVTAYSHRFSDGNDFSIFYSNNKISTSGEFIYRIYEIKA